LEKLRKEYMDSLKQAEKAEKTIVLSEREIQQVKRITKDVHDEVLRMQAELARIDERVRRRVERSLIEKGLRSARPGEYSDGSIAGTDQFAWPVIGRVSAGFHDAPYKEHFGVPHLGMDIVVAQGTQVRSAADGVVFLVRDGGETGYTYVLIGHRDGYATLYGHLSAVSVNAGDDVEQGQIIGLSGATPGTPGAGPMTTGPHLHFEVIQGGVNVNPRNVLP
jgi:murein DD-endopeptidase MepM/ murein hydrolase activator NlpD